MRYGLRLIGAMSFTASIIGTAAHAGQPVLIPPNPAAAPPKTGPAAAPTTPPATPTAAAPAAPPAAPATATAPTTAAAAAPATPAPPASLPPGVAAPPPGTTIIYVVGPPPEPPAPPKVGVRLHDGFYLRMSLGGGTSHVSTSTSDASTSSAGPIIGPSDVSSGTFVSEVGIGGTPLPGFVIGGDFINQAGALRGAFTLIGFLVDVFPSPKGGFHLGGTFGAMAFASSDTATFNGAPVGGSNRGTGAGGAAKIGYDWWIADQWSVGLQGQFAAGKNHYDGGIVTLTDTLTSFTIMFTALDH